MTQYIVSARKYRPETFTTLVGQDNIAQTLKNSIVRGQLAHAYLFCGPRGVGKTTTARIFAKAINCSNPSAEMEPCGECESCLSFAEGRSYCIHELDAASNNGVEDIKALMEQVRIPPQVGKYSVYIIDEVHMLSQAAFNAFLKTLEEPPAHAIFILATTEKHKILPTILSRCQTYDFNRITVDNIVRQLRDIARKEGVKIDDESLHVIANKADGAMRDALTIFDQTVAFCGTEVNYRDVLKNLNVLDYEYSFSLVENFLAGDYSKALLTFDEILTKGFNALHFVAALSSHFRDLVVAKSGGLDALLELPESLKIRYREQSARCPLKFLYDALAITTACETGYRASVNPRLHIEFALMRLSALSGALATAETAAAAAPAPRPAAPTTQPEAQPVAASQPAAAATPAPQPATASETIPAAPAAAAPAPSSAPAPAAPEEAEQPTQKRVRASRTGATSFSVKSLKEGTKQQAPEITPTAEPVALTDGELTAKWKELSGLYASRPRLATALSSASLEFTGDGANRVLTFKVMNIAQKNWIADNCLRDLEARFRSLTGTAIKLNVDIIPEEETPETAYTPSEKAEELMKANDEVVQLVKDMDLELK